MTTWISVKDSLPKDGANVLVFIKFRKSALNYVMYREAGKWYAPDRFGRFSFDDITHWMPLPQPPINN